MKRGESYAARRAFPKAMEHRDWTNHLEIDSAVVCFDLARPALGKVGLLSSSVLVEPIGWRIAARCPEYKADTRVPYSAHPADFAGLRWNVYLEVVVDLEVDPSNWVFEKSMRPG